MDEEAEKLSQEAFRLYRTAQNLLNLKEPTLSESKALQFHRNSLSDLKTTCNGMSSSSSLYAPSLQRKIKSRDSRISFQSSSTDGSVHSNSSSSRNETDEENALVASMVGLGVIGAHAGVGSSSSSSSTSSSSSGCGNRTNIMNNSNKFNIPNEMDALSLRKDRVKSVTSCHSVEDESGFSSMNSFHQDPAMLPPPPLNSTMISNQFFLDGNDELNGLPTVPIIYETKPNLPIMHKRWDSAPPIPPKRNLSTFTSVQNTSNDENQKPGIHVLWV